MRDFEKLDDAALEGAVGGKFDQENILVGDTFFDGFQYFVAKESHAASEGSYKLLTAIYILGANGYSLWEDNHPEKIWVLLGNEYLGNNVIS